MTSEARKTRFKAVVNGRVQGVCFRAYTRDCAREKGLSGYVRNRSDGAVEVEAVGDHQALREFEQWLHHGPPSARVNAVDVTWCDEGETFKDFSVRFGGGGRW